MPKPKARQTRGGGKPKSPRSPSSPAHKAVNSRALLDGTTDNTPLNSTRLGTMMAKASLDDKPPNVNNGNAQTSTGDKRPTCKSNEHITTRNKPLALDYHSYPHIISLVLELADLQALLHMRTTCKSVRLEVDTKYFAPHVVVENNLPRTRTGKISLRDRPELLKHTRTVDLKGSRCKCPSNSCSCLTSLAKIIEYVTPNQPVEIDIVRVFTSTLGMGDECITTNLCVNTTVYFLDLFPEVPVTCKLLLPFTPIGGSKRVVLNIRYDPTNPFIKNATFDRFEDASNCHYDVFFTPSKFPTYSSRSRIWYSGTAPEAKKPSPLGVNLVLYLARVLAKGDPRATLALVGKELWPTTWFNSLSEIEPEKLEQLGRETTRHGLLGIQFMLDYMLMQQHTHGIDASPPQRT